MTPEDPKPKFPALTAQVAAFAASTRIDDIPPEAQRLCKKSMLDSLGTGLSGSLAPVSDVFRRYLRQLGCGEGPSRAIGTNLRLPPRFAALLNGIAMHADDFDDTWQSVPDGPRARSRGRMGVHATAPALASVLAAGEAESRSGNEVLAACLVGIEVACKVFDATDFADIDNAFHATGTCALVGAAMGVANLRRMDEEAIRRMLGIACDQTSGLTVQVGTMAKPWKSGRSAECAVLAADLTALEFTAAETVLEDEGGYFQLEGGGYHEEVIHGLGDPWCFLDRGIWLKPYPTCSLGHPALTQLLDLVQEHDVGPDDVSRIRVRTRDGTFKHLSYHHPKLALEAKFSLEFCVATILLERALGLKHINDAFVGRSDVQDLIGRIEYTPYPEDEARRGNYALLTAFVEIEMKDGRKLKGRGDYSKGSKVNPMSEDEVAEKFRLCAEYGGLPGDRADRAIEMLASLEELSDVRELTALLTPDA